MGTTISQCVNRNPAKIVLLGLDASGKTTILYKFLRSSESIETFPTVGFNKEQITYKHFSMLFWDFGGKMIVKNLLSREKGFEDYDAIIFVVDSADRNSLEEARQELWNVLCLAPNFMMQQHLTVLLIMANKQDVKGAATTQEIETILELKNLPSTITYKIQGTCAVTGNGLNASLEWLTRTIKENRRTTVKATDL